MSTTRTINDLKTLPPAIWARFLNTVSSVLPDHLGVCADPLPGVYVEGECGALDVGPLNAGPGLFGISLNVQEVDREFAYTAPGLLGKRVFHADYDNDSIFVQDRLIKGDGMAVWFSCDTGEFCDDDADASVNLEIVFGPDDLVQNWCSTVTKTMCREVVNRALLRVVHDEGYKPEERSLLLTMLADEVESHLQGLPPPVVTPIVAPVPNATQMNFPLVRRPEVAEAFRLDL